MPSPTDDRPRFSKKTFSFLRQLARNNTREWFHAHKTQYVDDARDPALQLIADMAAPLAKLSPHFRADPKPVGGSLFRIHRDVRFSKDKQPYKTALGIQFRHELGRDAHAPGFYLHIQPGECFVGAGMWHPPTDAARDVRQAIVDDPKAWKAALNGTRFRREFSLVGDSLKRPPRGFDPEHPCLEDLKRKDFIAVAPLEEADIFAAQFVRDLSARFKASVPLMRFLCDAVDVPF